jgi:hypothetical protein
MDGQLLRVLYHELFHCGKRHFPRRCRYDDNVIIFIYFISVIADRSMRWAYDRSHWPLWARRLTAPSYSQVMRRLDSGSVQRTLAEVNTTFRARLPRTSQKAVDGKPLVVGVYSKDPDARWGKLNNHDWARGYKVHALADACGAVETFDITPLDAGESTVARQLVQRLALPGVTLRGDANYDANALYVAVAERGGRLVAPRRKPGTGLGHHRQHPDRLRAIVELEQLPGGCRAHRRHRCRIEQCFGHLTNLPFGLSPLPNWVRRLKRVKRWVTAKITLYHLYLSLRQTHASVA